MRRIGLILFWSVIAAAFIGPGTVTTAARAGADHGYSLLWALLFSTLACLLLQEMSARSYLVSGQSLGERIRSTFPSIWVRGILVAAIGIGGIAYEAGNLLGAVAGIRMLFPQTDPDTATIPAVIGFCLLAAVILWSGRQERMAQVLGLLVVVMGGMFLVLATQAPDPVSVWMSSMVVPTIPEDAEWLVLGLVGTTIVPYNVFLGGSIGKGQSVREMRLGLSVAVLLGGVISMAVLIASVGMDGEFSFSGLERMVQQRMGLAGRKMLGIGLMAAGFTSAVTAPWATALAIKGLFPVPKRYFQVLWGLVLLAGLIFGVSGLQPIPAIIAAQALNGLALPLVAIILLIMMNRGMGAHKNRPIGNVLGAFVVFVTLILGFMQLIKLLLG